jgi:hypothetical protein
LFGAVVAGTLERCIDVAETIANPTANASAITEAMKAVHL